MADTKSKSWFKPGDDIEVEIELPESPPDLPDSRWFGDVVPGFQWRTPQLFECLINFPGIGFRYTPSFADKVTKCSSSALWSHRAAAQNKDGTGPIAPKHMIATEFVKSEKNVTFLKCETGRGWLPLTNPAVHTAYLRNMLWS